MFHVATRVLFICESFSGWTCRLHERQYGQLGISALATRPAYFLVLFIVTPIRRTAHSCPLYCHTHPATVHSCERQRPQLRGALAATAASKPHGRRGTHRWQICPAICTAVESRHQKLFFISFAQPFAPTGVDDGTRAPARLRHRAGPQAAALLH